MKTLFDIIILISEFGFLFLVGVFLVLIYRLTIKTFLLIYKKFIQVVKLVNKLQNGRD